MSPWPGQRKLILLSACMTAAGSPEFVLNEVEIDYEDFTEGVQYDLVAERLLADGYEEPFVHFEQVDASRFLAPAVQQFLGASLDASHPNIPVLQEGP